MTARTKLTILERFHTLLMIAAGSTVGIYLVLLLPGTAGDGITLQDLAQLAVALIVAYCTAFLADLFLGWLFRPLRNRLRASA